VFKEHLDFNSRESKEALFEFARHTVPDFPEWLGPTDFIVELVSYVDARTVVLTLSSFWAQAYSVSLKVPDYVFLKLDREFIHDLVDYDD
jgi:hypothetical protein